MAGKWADCIYFKWKRVCERKRSISQTEGNNSNPAIVCQGCEGGEGGSESTLLLVPSTPLIKGPPLRSQRERPELAWFGTVNWRHWEGKCFLTQTGWALEEEKRKKMHKGWGKNTTRMMQKAVYACRQWVIFLFINEWADLGKGSFVDYNHNPVWQAPRTQESPRPWPPLLAKVLQIFFFLPLESQPNGAADLS